MIVGRGSDNWMGLERDKTVSLRIQEALFTTYGRTVNVLC